MTTVGAVLSLHPGSNFRLDLDGGYAHFTNEMERRNLASGKLDSDFNQNLWGLGARAGYGFMLGETTRLEPYAAIRWQHMKQDAINEGNASFANRMDSLTTNSVGSRVGVNLEHTAELGNVALTARLEAAWKHEFADTQFEADTRFAASTQSFVLKSAKLPRDTAELGVGFGAELLRRDDWSLSLEGQYGLDVGKRYTGHTFSAGLKIAF
jgi:outer membrane autotransporter barrel domain